RLDDFSKVKKKDYFYELCFCILVPQSKAKNGLYVEHWLRKNDFMNKNVNPLPVLKQRIRFHNNKTKYLIEAKQRWEDIEKHIMSEKDEKHLRMWLFNNVMGLGMKEASHFLRNIGKRNIAILDRHILKNLQALGVIDEVQTLTTKRYLEIEKNFENFANQICVPMDELDLLFWSKETGEIVK
ncbi:N-glycosylase/DNA lyase, partial [Candidatus Woesearchaeota archaeon]|nr:N-glycosylase/DNA lyase [Candidatus Woesearchaeota archaeon]